MEPRISPIQCQQQSAGGGGDSVSQPLPQHFYAKLTEEMLRFQRTFTEENVDNFCYSARKNSMGLGDLRAPLINVAMLT